VTAAWNRVQSRTASTNADFDALRAELRAFERDLRLDDFRLLAVQNQGRYTTVESWARETIGSIHHGKVDFGVDPVVESLELLFNNGAYRRLNIVYLKDISIRNDLTTHPVELSKDEIERIRATGLVSPDFFSEQTHPQVALKLATIGTKPPLMKAFSRTKIAERAALRPGHSMLIVPDPLGDATTPWHAPDDLFAMVTSVDPRTNMPNRVIDGMPWDVAVRMMRLYILATDGWQQRDAATVNEAMSRIAAIVPGLARANVYPSTGQREMEASYSRMNAFTWGYWIYLTALIFCIMAMTTGWRAVHWIAMLFFLSAVGIHAYAVGMRWGILGRIPVANMFEAVTTSALIASVMALALELRTLRAFQIVYLLAICVAVVIFSEFKQVNDIVWQAISVLAGLGLLTDMGLTRLRRGRDADAALLDRAGGSLDSAPTSRSRAAAPLRGAFILGGSFVGFLSLVLGATVGGELGQIRRILDDVLLRIHTTLIITSYQLVTLAFVAATGYLLVRALRHRTLTAWIVLGAELAATIALVILKSDETLASNMVQKSITVVSASLAIGALVGAAIGIFARSLGGVGMDGLPGTALISAGPTTKRFVDTPTLIGFDKCQMILLNMANVGLFVGVILGAVWADYSWGRPWGWDAKEVFAMNTWLIYAILIHVRMVTRDKALWTAVVACVGFGMMMFNWWAVNFFIVGLHSYA
jgi:ABC-type transport system involved in cytochrome c biogenesis permease subunit